MKIREAADASARHARKVKEDHVRQVKGDPERTDIMTVIEGFRGEEPAVVSFTPPDRDLMLRVAHFIAVGFSVDTLALTMESYGTLGAVEDNADPMINPDTGERWGPGEMGTYFQKHGPGVVVEDLVTQVINRAGDFYSVNQPYVIEGRRVNWQQLPEDLRSSALTPKGVVPETLADIMSQPTMLEIAGKYAVGLGLDHERTLFHGDMAALNRLREIIQEEGGREAAVMLFATPGSVRHQLLRERLGRSSVFDPREWN